MQFFPKEYVSFSTALPIQEVRRRLKGMIGQQKSILDGLREYVDVLEHKEPVRFRGSVYPNKFILEKITYYRYDPLPVLTGNFNETNTGTEIYMQIRMPILDTIVTGVIIAGVSLSSIIMLWKGFTVDSSEIFLSLVLLLAAWIIYMTVIHPYYYENLLCRTLFIELLEGQ